MNDTNTAAANKSWFALYVKPRHEFKAAEQISREGIKYYLPTIKKLKQWSDRKKLITEPVIKGYIFIYGDEKERLLSLEQPAVLRCVFDGGRPAVIPIWQMQNLSNFLQEETEYFLYEGLIPGSRVMITEGPFRGVIGIIQESDNQNMFAVSIDLLNRSVLTHVSKTTGFELVEDEKRVRN